MMEPVLGHSKHSAEVSSDVLSQKLSQDGRCFETGRHRLRLWCSLMCTERRVWRVSRNRHSSPSIHAKVKMSIKCSVVWSSWIVLPSAGGTMSFCVVDNVISPVALDVVVVVVVVVLCLRFRFRLCREEG